MMMREEVRVIVPFEAEAKAATVCHELAFVDGDSNRFGIVDGLLGSTPTEYEREKVTVGERKEAEE